MRRKGYRGVGCVKRSLSKCEGMCRTYDKIQTCKINSFLMVHTGECVSPKLMCDYYRH